MYISINTYVDVITCICLCSCAFLPNNGAFFVGYIILAAFIGTSFEWIRIGTFVQYVYYRLKAKSSAQRAYANKVGNQDSH